MIRILILLLFVMSVAAFAQTENAPNAVKIDEFEAATNGSVKMRMDAFYSQLGNNPTSQAYIINYGTEREIAVRERQIKTALDFRNYDASRITIVNGGFRDNVKTEFWLVPPGAEKPQPDSTARKFDEFARVPSGELKARVDSFFVELGDNPDSKGYIVLFGSAQSIAREEKRIRDYIKFRNSDPARITFKKSGPDKIGRTEFWIVKAKPKSDLKTKIYIVPPGSKPPPQ